MIKDLGILKKFNIRKYYDEEQEKWFFSIIDIVAILTEQTDHKKAKSYWTTLKSRLRKEGSQLVTNCDQLKMEAPDGKSEGPLPRRYPSFIPDKFWVFPPRSEIRMLFGC